MLPMSESFRALAEELRTATINTAANYHDIAEAAAQARYDREMQRAQNAAMEAAQKPASQRFLSTLAGTTLGQAAKELAKSTAARLGMPLSDGGPAEIIPQERAADERMRAAQQACLDDYRQYTLTFHKTLFTQLARMEQELFRTKLQAIFADVAADEALTHAGFDQMSVFNTATAATSDKQVPLSAYAEFLERAEAGLQLLTGTMQDLERAAEPVHMKESLRMGWTALHTQSIGPFLREKQDAARRTDSRRPLSARQESALQEELELCHAHAKACAMHKAELERFKGTAREAKDDQRQWKQCVQDLEILRAKIAGIEKQLRHTSLARGEGSLSANTSRELEDARRGVHSAPPIRNVPRHITLEVNPEFSDFLDIHGPAADDQPEDSGRRSPRNGRSSSNS